MSPPDRPPFPLIKSSDIFHLSVSRPRRSVAACSQVCLLTVTLQFTSDTGASAAVSPRSPLDPSLQPFQILVAGSAHRSDTSNIRSPDSFPESGDCHFLPKPFGSFQQSVDFLSTSPLRDGGIAQASDSHACDLTPLAANVFPEAEPAWFRGWKFQSPFYHFPYHYYTHSHSSPP